LRRAEQLQGARCTNCSKGRRGCSFIAEARQSKTSTRSTRGRRISQDEEEDVQEEAPKTSKGKGLLGSLARTFKRKPSESSPESPTISKKRSRSRVDTVSYFTILVRLTDTMHISWVLDRWGLPSLLLLPWRRSTASVLVRTPGAISK
jgi:hypothetical protein